MNEIPGSLAKLAGSSWTDAGIFLDDLDALHNGPNIDSPIVANVADSQSPMHINPNHHVDTGADPFNPEPDSSEQLAHAANGDPDASSLQRHEMTTQTDGYPPASNEQQPQPSQPQQVMIMNASSDLTQQEIDDILCNLVNNHPHNKAQSAATPEVVDLSAEHPPPSLTTTTIEERTREEEGEVMIVQNGLMDYLKMAIPTDNIRLTDDDQCQRLGQGTYSIQMRCFNCYATFTLAEFEQHCCEYDEEHKFIPNYVEEEEDASGQLGARGNVGFGGGRLSSRCIGLQVDMMTDGQALRSQRATKRGNKAEEDEEDEFVGHPVHKLLAHNQRTMRQWLKKDFRLDLDQILPDNICKQEPAPSTEGGIGGGGDQQLVVPGKKSDGPHKCPHCQRKFVHATGLARHLERHTPTERNRPQCAAHTANTDDAFWSMPLWTGNSGGTAAACSAAGTADALETATKCLRCWRIFWLADDALRHVCDTHLLRAKGVACREQQLDIEIEWMAAGAEDAAVNDFDDDDAAAGDNTAGGLLGVVIVTSVLQCEFCDRLFADLGALLRHSAQHDPRYGYECAECRIRVRTVRDIHRHWQAECVSRRMPHGLRVTGAAGLKDDKQSSAVLRYFVCNVCEHKFSAPAELYEHRRTSFHMFPRLSRRDDGAEVAQDWSGSTASGRSLCYACAECAHLASTAKEAVAHQAEQHGRRHEARAASGRRGAREAEQKQTAPADGGGSAAGGMDGDGVDGAVLNMSKYRQYLCDVCGKSYTQSSHLWQHLRFHKGVKPFACKEPNCTRRFTIRPDLNDHIRKCHTGERPYHCQICDKRFLTGSVFYQHRLIHRGERRYGCDDCGRRFYRADALKNHQRIHTGEKPFACTQCQKKFRQRGDRDKHVRARHSGLLAAVGGQVLLAADETTAVGGALAAAAAPAVAAARSSTGGRGGSGSSSRAAPAGGGSRQAGGAAGPARGRIRSKKDLLQQSRAAQMAASMMPALRLGNIPADYTGGVAGRGRLAAANAVAAAALGNVAHAARLARAQDVVYVGNMAFPSSMFRPVVSGDIVEGDGNGGGDGHFYQL